ncbi:cupin domain-containing protein [Adhaeribacter arboris]|nr:cupin domain-containing protein [Adhaeribacter arboris]
MIDNNQPILVNAGEGKEIRVGRSKLFLKLFSQDTANKFSITEYELPSGFPGPPAHKHRVFEHAWYVLEGELTVQVGDKLLVLTTGSFIFIPKRLVHAFANSSEALVKILVIDTPGGFENYYDDLQAAFGQGQAMDHEKMRKIQLQYDTYPPDYVF